MGLLHSEFRSTSRRVRLLFVTSDLLASLFSLDGSKLVKMEGVPADAKIVGVSDQIRFDSDQIAFKIESAEFSEVEFGKAIPEIRLQCSTSTPDYNWGLADSPLLENAAK